jgi:alanyl-tRNA synthetase
METRKLYHNNPYLAECEAEITALTNKGIQLNQTVFFGEAGGQIGDTGTIASIEIIGAQHAGGRMLFRSDAPMINVRTKINHLPAETVAGLQIGEVVRVNLDWERRYRIMRMHSAGHLVYYFALKFFGPDGAHKLRGDLKGCRLGNDSGRFDFPALDKLTAGDIERIQDTANDFATQGLDISFRVDSAEPDLRYWVCGEIEMYCGGTHVRNTREIGDLIVKRRSKGRGLERVYLELVS